MDKPICFVLTPFGRKLDSTGSTVDFDAVYKDLIAPAISDAGLEPLRADEEMAGGVIHKPTFERLTLCEYAVADLTTTDPGIFYGLGVRHAARPHSTVLIYGEGRRLPFDVAPLGAVPYTLGPDGLPSDAGKDRGAIRERLVQTRGGASAERHKDSPIHQLVEDYSEIEHTKTDVFRDRVQYSAQLKDRLAQARKQGADALRALEKEFGAIADLESGVVIDLFLSYRAVKAWGDMIEFVKKMPRPLAATVMVQEQLALALNRAGRGADAEKVLKDLLARRGPSSETYGLLGRVYKDRWEAALKSGERVSARGLLDEAAAAYLRGFEADWRDAYPGVNAVTLMELKSPPDPRREQLVPVVTYAVQRRIASGKPDYWDYATLLELAVIARDEQGARAALSDALANVRESWAPETTARNLRLIREAREQRQEDVSWLKEIEGELNQKT